MMDPSYYFHVLSAESLMLLQYVLSILCIVVCYKLMSDAGLILYCGLSVIIANIQVLKIIPVCFFDTPIAMGTILMMSSFLATDFLAEIHGSTSAKRAVIAGFFGMTFTSIMTFITIVMPNLDTSAHNVNSVQYALEVLFTPAPSLLISSIGAYLISQFSDVALFLYLKKILKGNFLWLRSLLSTTLSSFLDTLVFSLLAWRVFRINDIDHRTLIYTYILGSYLIRLLLGVLNAFLLPLMVRFARNNR